MYSFYNPRSAIISWSKEWKNIQKQPFAKTICLVKSLFCQNFLFNISETIHNIRHMHESLVVEILNLSHCDKFDNVSSWTHCSFHEQCVQEVHHIAELHVMCFPPFQERRDLCPSCVIVSNKATGKKIVSVIPHLLAAALDSLRLVCFRVDVKPFKEDICLNWDRD